MVDALGLCELEFGAVRLGGGGDFAAEFVEVLADSTEKALC